MASIYALPTTIPNNQYLQVLNSNLSSGTTVAINNYANRINSRRKLRTQIYNYKFIFHNCYRRTQPFEDMTCDIKDNNWLCGLNEFNNKIFISTALENDIFTNNRSAIITPKGKWKQSITPLNTDIVTATTTIGHRAIMAIVIYIPPWTTANLIKSIATNLHEIMYNNRSIQYILMGDVNIESVLWSDEPRMVDKPRANILENTFIHCNLASIFDPKKHPPTRITNTNGSRIDVILVSRKLLPIVENAKIKPSKHSDHNILEFELISTPIQKIVHYLNDRLYHNYIRNTDISFLKEIPKTAYEADIQAEKLTTIIKKGHQRSYKTKIIRKADLTTKTRKLIRKIKRKKRHLTKTHHNDLNATITIKKEANKLIKTLKKMEHNSALNKKARIIKYIQQPGREWQAINRIMGNKINKICNTNLHILKDKTKFMKSIDELTADYEDIIGPHFDNKTIIPLVDFQLTRKQFMNISRKALSKKCKFNKWLYNKTTIPIIDIHTDIIQNWIIHMARCGYTPRQMKQSKMVFIEKSDPNKARPLSIMNPFYRLIDKIVAKIIMKLNLKHKLLNHQYGFLPYKSCISMFIDLKEHTMQIKNQGKEAYLIAVDITGAFDNIPIITILRGLSAIDADINSIKLIHNHLSNRYSIFSKDDRNYWKRHDMGVPQGSFTGPLMYAIATALIGEIDCINGSLFSYADDIIITAVANNEGTNEIQKRWNKLEEIIKFMGLTINPNKTKIIPIYRTNKRKSIKLGYNNIKISRKINILGHQLTYIRSRQVIVAGDTLKTSCQEFHNNIGTNIPKLTSLHWRAQKILINSTLGGRINYFHTITTLWNGQLRENEDDIIMYYIGAIIKKLLDWRRRLNNITAYHIAIGLPPSIMIRRIIIKHCINNKRITPEATIIPKILSDPPNIPHITWTYHWPKLKSPYHETIAINNPQENNFLRYGRVKQGNYMYIRIWHVSHNNGYNPIELKYWTHGLSYLDIITDALAEYIMQHIHTTKEICIEADGGLHRRLSNPINKDRLQEWCRLNGIKISTIKRTENTHPAILSKNMKTLCPRFSKQEDAIWTLIYCQQISTKHNLASKMLASTNFTIQNSQKFTKQHIWALSNIAGSWRDRHYTETTCTNCHAIIDTMHLIAGCANSTNYQDNKEHLFRTIDYPTTSQIARIGYLIRSNYSALIQQRRLPEDNTN